MNYKIYFFILIYFTFLHNVWCVSAQNRKEVDSLNTLINNESDAQKRIDHFNNLADIHSDGNVDSAYHFVNIALQSALQLDYKKGQAESYYLLSYFDDRTGKTENAIEHLKNAIEIYTELGDSSYLAGCYNNLGVFYSYGTDQIQSLEYFIKAMNIAENQNQTFALSEAYNNIGWYYEYLEEYGSALKYYNKALEVDLKVNNQHNLALSYIMVGNVNLKLQRFDSARDSLIKAQQYISAVKDNYRQTELYINLADYYNETGQFDEAKRHIQLAKQLNTGKDYEKLDADILTVEADHLFKQESYYECLIYYDKAIEIYNENGIHDNLYDIYVNKAMACAELGKHAQAYAILKQAQDLKEEFEPNEIAKLLGEFEHSEALKEEKEKLRLEQEIQNQKNRNEVILIRAKLHGAVVSIAFLIILVAIFVYFYIDKRKHNTLLEENYKIIQEQKTLLEENFISLKNNEEKLSQLNATKDKFFSIIAHDLKNPFNVLIGLSDIVISDPEVRHSEDFKQIIDGIFHTAKSGYNLLDNLLKWARTQTGDIEFKPEFLDMKDVFDQNAAFFKETAKVKNIQILDVNLNGQLVYADFNMVNFIVRNLLNNAIKFSHPNSKIRLLAQNEDDFCIFTVQYFGVGMNKETREKLFKIQSASPKAGTADEMGTGLGLIICKEFIEKSGGNIWVESEEGKGSSFHVSFPCKKNH